jgi:cytosine/adenosine deaminase-related metal-dependent hydrolase
VAVTPRTRIRAGWVVGHERGAHTLDRVHEVVFEGDEILYVGPSFDGRVDRELDAAGKLVAPGFIDTHVHSGHRASHRLISDAGRGDYFGQPFLEISVPKEGTRIDGDVRYLRPDETGAEGEREFHALFTVAELLRNGVTTFVEYGSQRLIQEALKEQCLKLGVRGYLGPGYDSGRWVGDEHGRLKRVVNEENGWREFAGALEWIARHDGAGGGLVKGILVPRELETCSLDLLRATREKADELKLPMATHAAYSIVEFYETVREYRRTPIELLDELGMLRPTLNIGHGNLPADSVRLNYPGARDLALMGAAKASISHCPINIIRRARRHHRDRPVRARDAAHRPGARPGEERGRMRRRRRRRHGDRRGRDPHAGRADPRGRSRCDPRPRAARGRARLGELAPFRPARTHARRGGAVVLLSGVLSGR